MAANAEIHSGYAGITPTAHTNFCIAFRGFWSGRAKEWIGRTYQKGNRLRRATAPLTHSAIFSISWHLHAAEAAS